MMRFLREPLVQFLVVGAVLFSLSAMRPPSSQSTEKIHITAGQIENISRLFQRTWRRSPTETELDGLIAARVREEVVYREALALGLAEDDVIVRRRLVQKYDFVTGDIVSPAAPSDADLIAFLEKHPDKYTREPTLSFRQIFLRTGEDDGARFETLRNALREGRAPDALGDPIDLPPRFDRVPVSRIDAVLGPGFADQVLATPKGSWGGPIRSAFGNHFILLGDIIASGMPELTEVRARVERDWKEAQNRKTRSALYEKLRDNYDIRIDRHQQSADRGAAS